MSKKNNSKKGANIKPIEEMIENQESSAEKFFEALENNPPETNGEPLVEQTVEQIDEPLVDEPVENPIDEELHHKIKMLNLNIKGAIHYNKDKSTKGINGQQYKSIIDGYKRALGIDMKDEQKEYMKKLNFEQGKSVLHVINMFYKEFMYKRNISA